MANPISRRTRPSQARRQRSLSIRAGKRILVVDDGRGPLQQYSSVLEEAGYDVTRVGGSLAALFAIVRVEPDLVIAELRSPRQNDLALAHELKSHADTRHVPVVMVSASDTRKSRAAALEAGCDACLASNSSPLGFVGAIAKLLNPPEPGRLARFAKDSLRSRGKPGRAQSHTR